MYTSNIHIKINTHAHRCLHTYAYLKCRHTYIPVIHTHYMPKFHMYAYMSTCMNKPMHMYIHVNTHNAFIYTYMYVCVYIYYIYSYIYMNL
jgi:hypothetical protein